MFPKSTNETFATKLFQQYRNHKRLSKPKLARTDFTINHYAGDVSTEPSRARVVNTVDCLIFACDEVFFHVLYDLSDWDMEAFRTASA